MQLPCFSTHLLFTACSTCTKLPRALAKKEERGENLVKLFQALSSFSIECGVDNGAQPGNMVMSASCWLEIYSP